MKSRIKINLDCDIDIDIFEKRTGYDVFFSKHTVENKTKIFYNIVKKEAIIMQENTVLPSSSYMLFFNELEEFLEIIRKAKIEKIDDIYDILLKKEKLNFYKNN